MPDAPTPPPQPPTLAPRPTDPAVKAALSRYWRANITIMAVLLSIWAIVGLGCGVLFADKLNTFKLGGYPLGFWFAQQGAIIVFVLVILTYCILLNRLDNKHHEELEQIKNNGTPAEGSRHD
ncbi:MAG: DUF4212 domain-containing protein [Planctomycetota bacterium]